MAALRAALRTCTRLGNIGVGEVVTRQTAAVPLVSLCRGLRTPPAISSALSHATPGHHSRRWWWMTQRPKGTSVMVIEKVDKQVREGLAGRLFAVVFLQGKQHLVTPGDLVVVQTFFPPNTGDSLRLEKVMMVGSRDFSLYGRPLLGQDLVRVEATVVEKTLSHCRIYFYNRRRKNSRRTKFNRETHTILRINRIEITHGINEVPEVTGVDGRTL